MDDDDNLDNLPVPRGLIPQRRRGWQGEELEMDHQRELLQQQLLQHHGETTTDDKAVVVDIRQFQNQAVGEGYQAKHVIRQPSTKESKLKVMDLTGGGNASVDEKKSNNKRKDNGDRSYIQNRGLREFRKEIESILSSP